MNRPGRERDRPSIGKPVQIECELTIVDPNGAESVYAHTTQLIVPPIDELVKPRGQGKGWTEVTVAHANDELPMLGWRARARFRRVQ